MLADGLIGQTRLRSVAFVRKLLPMSNEKHTTTWPELAIGLYDKLTGRNAEITYDFQNLEVSVPSGTGAEAEHALWKVNGTLKIRTTEVKG